MPPPRHEKLGHFEIVEPLGEGGMGVVYRAHDPRLDRQVAVKVLIPAMAANAEARERLRREAVAAAALDHPYICKIFEIGESNGTIFLVMEFIAGQTLSHSLDGGKMSVPESLRVAGEIAEALEEAHARRFLHRDLKPANIMLTTQGHVKVMDFGLARRLSDTLASGDTTQAIGGSQLTVPGTILGTPDYMSPEQVKGLDLDPRSDQFAFGVILAEMLTGANPFRKASTVETLSAVIHETPQLHGEIPQALMTVIRRMLAKLPQDRYASMAEVRAELRRLAMPVEAAHTAAPQGQIVPIGREAELKQLTRQLDEALAGTGSLVMIGGEPGIGKTHLISALADTARMRGALVITGHCYEMEGSPSYSPFIEMIEWSMRNRSRDALRQALGEDAPEVARLMPELRHMFPDIPPALELPPDQQRRYLFNAYRAFIERVSRVTPTVAIFEDLHWADEPTLLLLEHLAKSVSTIPRLMIVTYRDVDLDVNRPFARTLESLLRQKLATRILLRRLPVAGVEQMIAALSAQTPPKSLARVVFEETEGNPFFVEEVFRHLAEEGKLFDDTGAFLADLRVDQLQVPEGVRLVLGRRLQRLSDEARRILTTAAVIGRVVPLELLEELEHAHPDAALDAVEEAERAHLVEAETSGRQTRYRFVHELVRQTLAETLSLPRRQRLHARIADAMEKVYASSLDAHISALAHHMYQAGNAVDNDKAVHFLTLAATRATTAAAFEEALQHIENALSLVEQEQSLRVADLEERRAICLFSLGRNDAAIQSLERAITRFEALGEHTRFIDACYRLYSHYSWSIQMAKLDEVAARLAPLSVTGPPILRFGSLAIQAAAAGMNSRIDSALALLDQLHQIPEDNLPPRLVAIAAIADRSVRMNSGQFHLCEASAKKVASLLDPHTDLWLLAANDYGFFGAPAVEGRLAENKRVLHEAITRAARVGHNNARFSALTQMAFTWLALGEMDAAEQTARETVAFGQSFPCGLLFIAQDVLGLVLAWRLKTEESLQSLRAAMTYTASYMAGSPEGMLALGMAAAGLDPAEAAAAAVSKLHRPGISRSFGSWMTVFYIVEALAIAGRSGEAALFLRDAEKIASEWQTSFAGFPARTAAGIAATGAADWERSEDHHRAAIAAMDASEYVVSRPIARVWYADMLLARKHEGDREQARTLLYEALAQSEKIGLALYARLASERLL